MFLWHRYNHATFHSNVIVIFKRLSTETSETTEWPLRIIWGYKPWCQVIKHAQLLLEVYCVSFPRFYLIHSDISEWETIFKIYHKVIIFSIQSVSIINQSIKWQTVNHIQNCNCYYKQDLWSNGPINIWTFLLCFALYRNNQFGKPKHEFCCTGAITLLKPNGLDFLSVIMHQHFENSLSPWPLTYSLFGVHILQPKDLYHVCQDFWPNRVLERFWAAVFLGLDSTGH